MSSKRPSPILLPGGLPPPEKRKLKDWLRRVMGKEELVEPERIKEVLEEKEKAPDPGLVQEDLLHRATVQLLPGRLEPLIPEVIQQEVRFQGTPGAEHEITLGWELGDPPHHVTLDHPSIQPLHAKMTFQFGSWMIESLAPQDPVEINGTPVPSASGPYLLANGDQIRIGDALFRFHLP